MSQDDPDPEITAELIKDLHREQHPDLADRPVRLGAKGWDNQRWRLEDDLAVRLPWATDSVAAPAWSGPPVWVHTDLHPANVLTADGALCGVVDFGALCAGDPAMLRRARGWAVIMALVCMLVGAAGGSGLPGGKASWGPPGQEALRRLLATAD